MMLQPPEGVQTRNEVRFPLQETQSHFKVVRTAVMKEVVLFPIILPNLG